MITPQEVFDILQSKFGEKILELQLQTHNPFIKISSDGLLEIAQFLRDDERFQFDYLSCLSGMDYEKTLGVVYHLFSMKKKHKIVIKVEVSKENPIIPSVEKIWKTANWHEREAYDLFGIIFSEHPDLRRILLPYDWEGHPLRKDYQVPEYYNGMKVPY